MSTNLYYIPLGCVITETYKNNVISNNECLGVESRTINLSQVDDDILDKTQITFYLTNHRTIKVQAKENTIMAIWEQLNGSAKRTEDMMNRIYNLKV